MAMPTDAATIFRPSLFGIKLNRTRSSRNCYQLRNVFQYFGSRLNDVQV